MLHQGNFPICIVIGNNKIQTLSQVSIIVKRERRGEGRERRERGGGREEGGREGGREEGREGKTQFVMKDFEQCTQVERSASRMQF